MQESISRIKRLLIFTHLGSEVTASGLLYEIVRQHAVTHATSLHPTLEKEATEITNNSLFTQLVPPLKMHIKISIISYWNTRLEPGLSTLCLRGMKATLSFHKLILPREFTWISVLVIAHLNLSFLICKVGTTVSSRLGCWGYKGRLCEVSCDAGLGTRGPYPMDADHSCPGCLEGPALPPHLPFPWVGPGSVGSPQVPQECPV